MPRYLTIVSGPEIHGNPEYEEAAFDLVSIYYEDREENLPNNQVVSESTGSFSGLQPNETVILKVPDDTTRCVVWTPYQTHYAITPCSDQEMAREVFGYERDNIQDGYLFIVIVSEHSEIDGSESNLPELNVL